MIKTCGKGEKHTITHSGPHTVSYHLTTVGPPLSKHSGTKSS